MRQSIILASKSPRRSELLRQMGISFSVHTADVSEETEAPPRDAVLELAIRKAHAAAEELTEGLVLAADTLVAVDEKALGKPTDEADARRMLKLLSGREHDVYTGLCITDAATGCDIMHVERTGIVFRELTDAEIDEYISTKEPMDKAGAYAIQGGAGKFVASIDGSFENVMGLPVQALQKILSEIIRM